MPEQTDPNELSSEYEKILTKQILDAARQIKSIYFRAITDISLYASIIKQFNPDDSPALRKQLEKILTGMHTMIEASITNSITQAWGLSNDKNDIINGGIVGDRVLTARARNLIYNPKADALIEFYLRKENGLNLSDRVWNLVKPYRFELEAGLTEGINAGRSAASMATELKKYLGQPDKLFRRVRDENGKLTLSKAAKAYHPGQGIFRSSFKNAIRLTATETNIAYKSADYERWNNETFVTGIEIKLSNRHIAEEKIDKDGTCHICDICNKLVGIYSKSFIFKGFHPFCRCYALPILISDSDFNKLEDKQLGLAEDAPSIDYVKGIPEKAAKWIKDNSERIQSWGTKPFWLTDNPKLIKPLLK